MINDRPAQQQAGEPRGINASAPETAAERIVVLRMLPHEQRLGLPVARLLFEVGPQGRAAIMPDKTRRAESELEIMVLQSPTHVHVVPRAAENRIEQPDFLERALKERHVAAGDVFGFAVGQHHMGRPAG